MLTASSVSGSRAVCSVTGDRDGEFLQRTQSAHDIFRIDIPVSFCR
ncbi:hypothetical protein GFS60_07453 (plasmid) [Rhodococcus sp. WAY2]|nr:hypothetical protein GFS60_07453 [Rhodococcus sp. WAY2]